MLVTYGGTQLGDVGATRFTWGRSLLVNKADIGYGFKVVANFPEVFFRCANYSDCLRRMANIEAATGSPGGDLIVRDLEGNMTTNAVNSSETVNGVRCTNFTWLDKPGAQFLTYRVYTCSFEWETVFPDTRDMLVSFSEKLVRTGGEPEIVILEPINALPVAQVTVPMKGFRAVQEGSAVGLRRRPNPLQIAPPIWPDAMVQKTITEISAERLGYIGRNFGVQWRYEYVSATNLAGSVTEWVG